MIEIYIYIRAEWVRQEVAQSAEKKAAIRFCFLHWQLKHIEHNQKARLDIKLVQVGYLFDYWSFAWKLVESHLSQSILAILIQCITFF